MAGSVLGAVSVIVSTHDSPLSLKLVLLALARQSRCPDEVVIADDGSGDETTALLRALAPRLPYPLVHVWQPHEGFRAARSRNNGIAVAGGEGLAFLDQDTLPHRTWLSEHLRRLRPGGVCLGHVLDLSDAAVEGLDESAVEAGAFETRHAPADRRALQALHRRACWYAMLRRARVGVKAKPRLRSCNFSVAAADLRVVNGFDESYVGWGQEDDDLGRRLYRAGIRPVVVIDSALVSHWPHPPRRGAAWGEGANAGRYARGIRSARCEAGLDAHPHPDVRVRLRSGGV